MQISKEQFVTKPLPLLNKNFNSFEIQDEKVYRTESHDITPPVSSDLIKLSLVSNPSEQGDVGMMPDYYSTPRFNIISPLKRLRRNQFSFTSSINFSELLPLRETKKENSILKNEKKQFTINLHSLEDPESSLADTPPTERWRPEFNSSDIMPDVDSFLGRINDYLATVKS